MSTKIFDNNLVETRKGNKLNKPAYIRMFFLELSKVLMYEFHYNHIKNKCDSKSKLLFTYTDSLMYEIKTEDFNSNKEMFDFSNYLSKSKHCHDSNKLFIGKMKNKTGSVAEFVGLKQKMYSFLVDDNGEHKKAKGVNRNIVAIISHNEYKDVLLSNKCLRHSRNSTQCKDHRIGTYEINKILLSCFDGKIYIQKNGYDELALGYQR